MTTVADYLHKLSEQHGVGPDVLTERYVTFKQQGVATKDALKMIEDELRARLPVSSLEEELPESAPAGGVDVDAFILAAKTEASEWITTAEIKEGDEFEVTGAGEVDDETFERSYVCVPVRFKGEDRKLRLGVKNVERIKKKLGSNTAQWVGKRIRVTVVETVKGLSKKHGIEVRRMILDGV